MKKLLIYSLMIVLMIQLASGVVFLTGDGPTCENPPCACDIVVEPQRIDFTNDQLEVNLTIKNNDNFPYVPNVEFYEIPGKDSIKDSIELEEIGTIAPFSEKTVTMSYTVEIGEEQIRERSDLIMSYGNCEIIKIPVNSFIGGIAVVDQMFSKASQITLNSDAIKNFDIGTIGSQVDFLVESIKGSIVQEIPAIKIWMLLTLVGFLWWLVIFENASFRRPFSMFGQLILWIILSILSTLLIVLISRAII